MSSVLHGPMTISPVVTRLRWPPEMPRIRWLPMSVSAHTWHGARTNAPAQILATHVHEAFPAGCSPRSAGLLPRIGDCIQPLLQAR